jgi:hypothetical protein
MAETEFLREWCAWVRGDPKLSQREEAFATSIYRGLNDEDRRFLRHKQTGDRFGYQRQDRVQRRTNA